MILSALEEKEDLLKVINENIEDRINILIGSEISCESVDSCSLVISKYKMKNGPTGKIAILGPTRMHYDKVVSTLDYVSEMMQEVFLSHPIKGNIGCPDYTDFFIDYTDSVIFLKDC